MPTSRAIPLRQLRVTDPFWEGIQETVRREVIPYQWEALNDRVPGAEASYSMHNFRAAGQYLARARAEGERFQPRRFTDHRFQRLPEEPGRVEEDQFYGFLFQDSDVYKWIEAVAYSLTRHPDAELEATADAAIETVCAAQRADGYLDTYYILCGMDASLTNLRDNHELYCFGHLTEAAVAYWQATGKDRLLRAACRFADWVDAHIGPEENKLHAYPGHEVAELALVKLWEATGEARYLRLSEYFINERGQSPNYFVEEEKRRNARFGWPDRGVDRVRLEEVQAHLPVREQPEITGHAVRAMYLAAGMADIARLSEDASLIEACERLWRSTAREKLYVTGGVGGSHVGEIFSYPYDLPNDTAYSETCAAIGLVFFARRMLQLHPRAEVGDVMELALYNTVLAGMALDGKSFFYVNPLESVPAAVKRDRRMAHVKTVRQKWFGCACCPPNIARTVTSVGAYAWTAGEDTLYTHLYLGGTVETQLKGQRIRLLQESGFPWSGQVRVTIQAETPVPGTLAFRIPGWTKGAKIIAPEGICRADREGYCYLTGAWTDGMVITLQLPMPVRLLRANPRVKEDQGKLAVSRGPLTYCAEEADNGPALHLLRLGANAAATEAWQEIDGHPVLTLCLPAERVQVPADAPLYSESEETTAPVSLTMIPYYAWNNRGEGEMRVWIPEK